MTAMLEIGAMALASALAVGTTLGFVLRTILKGQALDKSPRRRVA
jgi:hypothetical protein